MERNEIIELLRSNGVSKSEDSTIENSYADSPTIESLVRAVGGNRLQAGWKKAQYIVAKYKNTGYTLSEIQAGWRTVVAQYRNQYLLLEYAPNEWRVYDSECNEITLNALFHKKSVIKSDTHSSSYLSALRTKPFLLLAGISGTGKSRIVRKLAQATVTEELQRKYDKEYNGTDFENDRWKLHRPANFELIQVKPNWHNSMDVLGYLSNIPTPHYVFTPFVNFIVKAWVTPDVPFFLCLDEMNLAPVEEYFAEFLSAIESRSKESGKYETDPIIKPFDEFGNGVSVAMIKELNDALKTPMGDVVEKHLRAKGLTLPENLLVIGTVNMDETTFSFSRKVLDRAMSIEMNEVDYGTFLAGSTDDGLKAMVKELEESDTSLASLLVNRHIEAREVVGVLGEEARKVIDYLERVNRLLDGTPFKLGYRAANEALIYLQSVLDFGGGGLTEALDQFTLMKILSRIEGDETKLKITNTASDEERISAAQINKDAATQHGDLTLLTALRYIITDTLGEYYQESEAEQEVEPSADESEQDIPQVTSQVTSQVTAEEAEATESEAESAPTTSAKKLQRLAVVKKLDSMISQLKRDHFVSFWN